VSAGGVWGWWCCMTMCGSILSIWSAYVGSVTTPALCSLSWCWWCPFLVLGLVAQPRGGVRFASSDVCPLGGITWVYSRRCVSAQGVWGWWGVVSSRVVHIGSFGWYDNVWINTQYMISLCRLCHYPRPLFTVLMLMSIPSVGACCPAPGRC
jgi:hypothetical protein